MTTKIHIRWFLALLVSLALIALVHNAARIVHQRAIVILPPQGADMTFARNVHSEVRNPKGPDISFSASRLEWQHLGLGFVHVGFLRKLKAADARLRLRFHSSKPAETTVAAALLPMFTRVAGEDRPAFVDVTFEPLDLTIQADGNTPLVVRAARARWRAGDPKLHLEDATIESGRTSTRLPDLRLDLQEGL